MEPKLIATAFTFALTCFMVGFGLGYRAATHRVLRAYEEGLNNLTKSFREERERKNNERKRHDH